MVCVACLIPLFLIPIINILPRIFDLLMRRIYKVFGWEYKAPERVPPSCPYKPANVKVSQMSPLSDSATQSLSQEELPNGHKKIS